MPNFRSVRWIFPSILTGILLMCAILSSSAGAVGYGETLRFGGQGTNSSSKGKAFILEEQVHAFGVDTTNGNIFVGDEKSASSEDQFRIQMYNSAGAYQAEAVINAKKAFPAGVELADSFDGIAVDHAKERVYVLITYERPSSDSIDARREVAGAVYAFSTVPVSGALVPAAGVTNSEGLFASSTVLDANSEVQGQALLNPSGIAVDPSSHEVLILGESDEGGTSGEHAAFERLSEAGKLEKTYVAPEKLEVDGAPNSPAVSPNGIVFFERQDTIDELSSPASTAAPKAVFKLEEPELIEEGPFKEEIIEFGDETTFGNGLSVISEGASSEGRLVAAAEVDEVLEDGKLGSAGDTAALNLHYTEAGGSAHVTEAGWVGAATGTVEGAGSCLISGEVESIRVAAAPGDTDFVLDSTDIGGKESGEVIEFGPGGEHCPVATPAPGGIEATLEGVKDTELNTGEAVDLEAKIIRANVLSVEWKFPTEGENKPLEESVPGEQTQTAEIEHKFSKAGKVTVEAVIHTDDLATPVITVTTVFNVEPPTGGPKVSKQPASVTAVEGESATFVAEATGKAPITVQWEAEAPGATKFTPIAGATSDTLVVGNLKTSETGTKYLAQFSNSVIKDVASNVATLTVEAPSAPSVSKQPASQTVTEGQSATFDAEAAGAPTPTVQWQVSTDGGAAWSAVPGATAEALKVPSTTLAENGYQYRAVFSNTDPVTKVTTEVASNAATLTVNAQEVPPPPPPPPNTTTTPPPQNNVLPFKEASPKATIAGTSLTVSSSGAVSVKVSCATGVTTCTGTVTLRTLTAVAAQAGAHSAKAKASVLTLASGSFTVAGGQAKTITLHLSAAARKLFARSHSVLRARTTILARNPQGVSSSTQLVVTLRAAKKKKK
jgi:hypothetical protein